MPLTKERTSQIIQEFGGAAQNSGSTEAQIALITERINFISGHLQKTRKDHNTSRNLLRLVGQRKRLLKYLHDTNLTSYRALIEKLNLRK